MQPLLLADAQLSLWLHQYLLPFIRIGAMFMAMPVLGARVVPARVRIGLAMMITLIVVPLLPDLQVPELLSVQTGLFVFQELMLGVAFGFVFQIFFQVFVLAGQYLAMKMGLGFASMNDPVNGVQTTVLSQFYMVMVTVLFVSSGWLTASSHCRPRRWCSAQRRRTTLCCWEAGCLPAPWSLPCPYSRRCWLSISLLQ